MPIDLSSQEMASTLSRNETQEVAMTAIYDVLHYIDMKLSVDVEGILSSLCDCPYEDVDPFIKSTVIMTVKHYGLAVNIFNAHMRSWTFDRLVRIERAILLLAFSHFFYVEEDVDKRVVINIAVKLAKKYCEANDYKFVNAILDNILVRKENPSEEGTN
ncbi:MAG: hypothetical protein K6B65_04720 [Bacilli bacterium]|nr:hypothetical protein [Bacilli bacterium]